jgi:hypothetical protein
MRYFHRTSVSPDRAIDEATKFFGQRLAPAGEGPRRRTYAGTVGNITVSARPEGGHYTLLQIETDQLGESELDKLAKRFLSVVHSLAHREHEVRGAY